ncbi:MAG: hypothetical protein U5K30_04630 [Acidimicrobiales bacterium]|nr:hypothetical protein [Acidimicrobiales bacterium]
MSLFGFRVAPGLRLTVSQRGLRAGIGPRIARLHVGSGRPGVSTGKGSAVFYTSLGGSKQRRGSGRAATGHTRALSAPASKRQRAEQIQAAITGIASMHTADFPPATAPDLGPAPPEPLEPHLERRRAEAKSQVPFWRFGQRRAALTEAERLATDDQQRAQQERAETHRRAQAEADEAWARLLDNDRDVVADTLDAAFDDNDAPAVCVAVDDRTVDVVLAVPSIEALPERTPGVTDAGNLSLRKMNKTDRNALHAAVVYGHLLLTVKETFAIAPNIDEVRAFVVRDAPDDVYGTPRVEPVVAAAIRRDALAGVQWDAHHAETIVTEIAHEHLVDRKGRARDVVELELDDEPELAAALDTLDLTDLVD